MMLKLSRKKQHQEKISDDNYIPEDALNGVKESKETFSQGRQTVADIKDVLEEISNGSEMSKETVPQDEQPVVDIKDVVDEILSGPDEDLKLVPAVTRKEPAPILEDIIKDVKESEETAPRERQPVIDINDVVDEILNDSETLPTVNQKESTVNDTPSIAVNGAIKSVENSTTDNSRELKVKHPQSRVGVKRGVNKRLLLKSKDRHAKHHKYNKKINR